MEGMKEIRLPMDPYQAGYRHGKSCRNAIREFLSDGLGRMDALRGSPLDRKEVFRLSEAHGRIIREDLPDMHAELCGLAAGAGILPVEAVLLQSRREIIAAATGEAHGCSLLGFVPAGGHPVLAQTVDLEGGVDGLARMFRIEGGPKPEILMFSLAGLLGYLGMNSSGLAIGINMVLSGGWRDGVSPYLLVRHLLSMEALDDCLEAVTRMRLSSSRSLTLLQGGRCANIEFTPERSRIREGLPSLHTNHFLHPEMAREDLLNPISRNSSKARLELLRERLGASAPSDGEGALAVLADHSLWPTGICMHAQGFPTRPDTVASVAMVPAAGEFHFRPGHACEGRTVTYTLDSAANRKTHKDPIP